MTIQPSIPPQVLARLEATVREVLETPELVAFAIGRGSSSAEASARGGADAVIEIFRTLDPDEAIEVEAALTLRFGTHPKARGTPLSTSASTEGWVRVYLALWARPST